ncbi:MAG: class I SAM-dependent methyltransferase [Beijerinckiaceae bacterium]
MSFSAEWLALREPVDHRARNRDVLEKAAAHFQGRNHIAVVDLGCGAGSNLRGCALALPVERQSWTLVDYDPALLAAARERLMKWADSVHVQGEELVLDIAGKSISVDFRQLDLNRDLAMVMGWQPDLVTAAALFDLVSEQWLRQFVETLTRHGLPLYTALTYDGRETWMPGHKYNAKILTSFLAHQETDKGFGPAAGPRAGDVMEEAFRAAGYAVATGLSPWKLGPYDFELARQLIAGIANAAAEIGRVSRAEIEEWYNFRHAQADNLIASALIGHVDIFAHKP